MRVTQQGRPVSVWLLRVLPLTVTLQGSTIAWPEERPGLLTAAQHSQPLSRPLSQRSWLQRPWGACVRLRSASLKELIGGHNSQGAQATGLLSWSAARAQPLATFKQGWHCGQGAQMDKDPASLANSFGGLWGVHRKVSISGRN